MTFPIQPEQKLPFYALTGDEATWDGEQQARWDRVLRYATHTAVASYLGREPNGNEPELSGEGQEIVAQIAQEVTNYHRTHPLPGEDRSGYIAYLTGRDAQVAPGNGGNAA